MFRGAIILGIGFGLGYAHAMHNNPEILKALTELTDVLREALEQTQEEQTEEEKSSDTVIDGQAVETPNTPEGE